MKKQLFFAVIALTSAVVIFSAFFWAHTDWANTINWSISGACSPSPCTLTASNIPTNEQAGSNKPYRRVWYYGDGTYLADYYTVPGSSNGSFSSTYTHTAGLADVWLELTPTYDDRDKPKNHNFSTGGSNNPPAAALPYNSTIGLFQPLTPRQGDTVTYVLNYGNPCTENEQLDTGYVAVTFPEEVVKIISVHTFYNEIGVNTANANSTGVLTFGYNNLKNGAGRNVFIRVAFEENVTDTTVLFSLNHTAPSSCIGGSGSSAQVNNTLLALGKPHDPNSIKASKPYLCPNGAEKTMDYTIVFQNIGNAPASKVTVKETLPEYFLMPASTGAAELTTIDPPGLTYTVKTGTREITWELSVENGFLKQGTSVPDLKGTQQLLNKTLGFTEDDTKDSIVFRVTFDPSKPLPPCGAIPNRAEIIFDSLEAIVTNDDIAKISCQNCMPCSESIYATQLPDVNFDGLNPVALQIPGANAQMGFDWYPPIGLDNTHSASPNASPATTTQYTAIVRDSCNRQVYKILVKVDQTNSPNSPNMKWCWWLLLLLPLLWLIIRRRRNNDQEEEQQVG